MSLSTVLVASEVAVWLVGVGEGLAGEGVARWHGAHEVIEP